MRFQFHVFGAPAGVYVSVNKSHRPRGQLMPVRNNAPIQFGAESAYAHRTMTPVGRGRGCSLGGGSMFRAWRWLDGGPKEVRYLSSGERVLGEAVEQEAAMSVDVKRVKDFTWVWVSVAATAPTWKVVRCKVWRDMKLPQNLSSRLILQIIRQKDSVFTGLIGHVVRAIHVSHTERGSEAPARDQSYMYGN